ncbi:cupin domain-containing protein [Paenibacillus nicotianae]|uniref:Cupin domain-containing protein n=1 Tax=Paenibacillus nicotianae TaxID=1526551 RepID=A0ABW4UXC2_9BACL
MSNLGVWEDAEPGVKRCILNANSGLMMMEVHFAKGAEGSQHQHPHQQMSYCLRGSFTFTIDNQQTTLTQGQSINIPPNASHGVVALEDDSALLDVFTPIREDLLKL